MEVGRTSFTSFKQISMAFIIPFATAAGGAVVGKLADCGSVKVTQIQLDAALATKASTHDVEAGFANVTKSFEQVAQRLGTYPPTDKRQPEPILDRLLILEDDRTASKERDGLTMRDVVGIQVLLHRSLETLPKPKRDAFEQSRVAAEERYGDLARRTGDIHGAADRIRKEARLPR